MLRPVRVPMSMYILAIKAARSAMVGGMSICQVFLELVYVASAHIP